VAHRLGILGGGQLAMMLANAAEALAKDLNISKTNVYCEGPEEPAAKTSATAVFGKMNDSEGLKNFFKNVDIVLFENEFLDVEIVKSAATGLAVTFVPELKILNELQDKSRQKQLLEKLQIPTAPFLIHSQGQDLKTWIESALKLFEGEYVFKWSKLGYDGKGVLIGPKALPEIIGFCQNAKGVFAEEKISFDHELAMVACRNHKGEFKTYPLVVSVQQKGICKKVMGPATSLGISLKVARLAEDYCVRLAEHLGIVGTFAVEFFFTSDGPKGETLLVNEIAPRVHNSGHFTMDACPSSQFENHISAALDFALGSTRTTPAFAMLNLLGPEGVTVKNSAVELPEPPTQSILHWYGKEEIRPGRKVGHINAMGISPGEIPKLVKRLEAFEQMWIEAVKKNK